MIEILIEQIQEDIKQLSDTSEIPKAVALNSKLISKLKNPSKFVESNYRFNEKALPLYFTGNPDSEIITITLNPYDGIDLKYDNGNLSGYDGKVEDVDSYIDFCKSFGAIKTKRLQHDNKSFPSKGFDYWNLNFFKGFSDSELNLNNEDDFVNYNNLRTNRLQLELIPYASKSFDGKGIENDIEIHFKQILDIIKTKSDPKVVIFGKPLYSLLIKLGYIDADAISQTKFVLHKSNGDQYNPDDFYVKSAKINDVNLYFLPFLSRYNVYKNALQEYGKMVREFIENT